MVITYLSMKFFLIASISFLFLSVFFISCREEPKEDIVEVATQNSNSLYGNTNFTFPKLSVQAQNKIPQWIVFDDFEQEAKEINGSTIEALRVKSERLLTRTDSLSNKIPDSLFSNAVFSRLMIVKTRASLLKQEVNKSRIDSLKVQEYINETNTSVRNFIVQINEKFQKDMIDLERKDDEQKELEKQKRFTDSVYKSEIKNKKN